MTTRRVWAAEWYSKNGVDGERRHLLGHEAIDWQHHGVPATFKTHAICRRWIKQHSGYIADRPDLQAEPHGWRVPQPVRVEIKITKI
jgi:hypothetical protein